MTESAFDAVQPGGAFQGAGPGLVDAMESVVPGVCPKPEFVTPEFEPLAGALRQDL